MSLDTTPSTKEAWQRRSCWMILLEHARKLLIKCWCIDPCDAGLPDYDRSGVLPDIEEGHHAEEGFLREESLAHPQWRWESFTRSQVHDVTVLIINQYYLAKELCAMLLLHDRLIWYAKAIVHTPRSACAHWYTAGLSAVGSSHMSLRVRDISCRKLQCYYTCIK